MSIPDLLRIPEPRHRQTAGVLMLGALLGLGFLLPTQGLYLDRSLHGAGSLLIAWILLMLPSQKPSLKYLPVVLILIPSCLFLGTGTLRYFLLVFSILLVIESVWCKSGTFALGVLFTVSPVATYLSEVFTFPIRLFLSEKAGLILRATGSNVVTEGNTIVFNGQPFHVDPTCMGLQMLSVSFLAGIFLLIHFQKRYQKQGNVLLFLCFLSTVFFLNLAANFFRILVLVRFQILPESPAHELVGLVCVLVYVWLPSYYVARTFVKKAGRPGRKLNTVHGTHVGYLLINFLVLTAGIQILLIPKKTVGGAIPKGVKGAAEEVRQGITAFRTATTLTYHKQIPAFYALEHNPQVCWRGNGYLLRSITANRRSEGEFYMGKLSRNNETLYTAWWFTNGQHQTIKQLDWRWRMLRGENPFVLINVTAANPEDLRIALDEWFDTPPLSGTTALKVRATTDNPKKSSQN